MGHYLLMLKAGILLAQLTDKKRSLEAVSQMACTFSCPPLTWAGLELLFKPPGALSLNPSAAGPKNDEKCSDPLKFSRTTDKTDSSSSDKGSTSSSDATSLWKMWKRFILYFNWLIVELFENLRVSQCFRKQQHGCGQQSAEIQRFHA